MIYEYPELSHYTLDGVRDCPPFLEPHAYVMTMYATVDNVAQHSKLRNENKCTVIDSSDKNRTTTQIKTSEFNRFVYEWAQLTR